MRLTGLPPSSSNCPVDFRPAHQTRVVRATGLIVLLAVLAVPERLLALESILLEARDSYVVSSRMEFLKDGSGTVDFEQARLSPDWQASRLAAPAFDFEQKAYWFRFRLENRNDRAEELLLELGFPQHDYVDLYVENSPEPLYQTGALRPASSRPLYHPRFVFPLTVEPHASLTIYMRIENEGKLSAPVPLTLWQATAMARRDAVRNVFISLLVGGSVLMGLYNFTMFFVLRDRSFAYFAIYLTVGLLFFAGYEGYLSLLVFPDTPIAARISQPIAIDVSMIFLVLFTLEYLETARHLPRLHRAAVVLVVLLGIHLVISPFVLVATSIAIVQPLLVVATLLLSLLGTASLFQGNRAARFYMLAEALFLLGALIFIAKGMGILQSNEFTENVLHGGVLAAILLFSLGLADRINTLRLEREAAQKRVQSELSKRNEELSRLDRLKDEFLANTSHELRTPLNGIIGLTESLLLGVAGPIEGAARSTLDLIASSARRLASMVNDLLDFSRIQHGDMQLNLQAVDLAAVTDVVLALSNPLIGSRNLKLLHEPGNIPLVLADEARLEQILLNLVGNAIKFTKEGTISLSYRVLATPGESEPRYVEVTVSDTGIGIPPDRQQIIFDAFSQADGSVAREYGGTGLGLSITRKLVELHGGRLGVFSRAGEGSRFFFTLLIADSSARNDSKPADSTGSRPSETGQRLPTGVAVAAASAEQAPEDSNGPHTGVRTLIVDDDPVNLQVLSNHLALEGHSVIAADNGREALRLLESEQEFDLILLDVMMPGLSGYEVCRVLRESFSETELPVIMLTARNRISDLIAGLESGANDYLTKPFEPRELIARARTMLKLRQAAQSQSHLAAIRAELQLAREIQLSLLPPSLPEVPGLDIAVRYRAMENVGGDFYDVLANSNGAAFFMADVSGHGVPAALIVSIVKIAFWFQKDLLMHPDQLLAGMNSVLLGNTGNGFVTACYAYIDLERRVLLLGCAGHPPVFLYRKRDQSLVELRPRGRILGIFASAPYSPAEVPLETGDRLVMYTDGIIEARNADQGMFGDDRFRDFIQEHGEFTPEKFADTLMQTIVQWSGGPEKIEDDIALIVVDVR